LIKKAESKVDKERERRAIYIKRREPKELEKKESLFKIKPECQEQPVNHRIDMYRIVLG